ncbi:MAG: hypothetical protein RL154_934, partial [Pseudomonadota bacterium]
MVTVSAMSAGTAAGYFTSDDYLSADEGSWRGEAAQSLGLSQGDGMQKKDFVALLNGFAPKSLTDADLLKIDAINKSESQLKNLTKQIDKMPDGDEKAKAKEELKTLINEHNEIRKEFNESKGDAKIVEDNRDGNGILTHRAG